MRILSALLLLTGFVSAAHSQHPRDKEIKDPDTLAWWHTTEALSGDNMEGRDTGSAAYQRAADLVADRFRAAGLKPAGDRGTFFQSVPMHEIAVDPAGTRIFFVPDEGKPLQIAFLRQLTLAPAPGLPTELEAPLTFRGYCGKNAMKDIAGKIVLCYGVQRKGEGFTTAAERTANARDGKAAGLLTIDDAYFALEPPRWPAAYARTVTLEQKPASQPETAAKPAASTMLQMRLTFDYIPKLIEGSKHEANEIWTASRFQKPMPSFDIPAKLKLKFAYTERSYSSPNVLAMLPGTDRKLKNEYVVLAAHLDGYGYGTPLLGDNLYNGALDDAAYVALLIQFAEDLHRDKRSFPRSILFCAFTGEEKGLLGSNYFVDHPTVPLAQLAADINLDQLRPLFPLDILTALAIDDTTLGDTVRNVAASMKIEIRPDLEPERNLLRRADHFPFLRVGVPAVGFIFGYDPGSEAEIKYRQWYQIRYHRPQDDLTQPMDFEAATRFNTFFYKLAAAVASQPNRPAFVAGNPYQPKS